MLASWSLPLGGGALLGLTVYAVIRGPFLDTAAPLLSSTLECWKADRIAFIGEKWTTTNRKTRTNRTGLSY